MMGSSRDARRTVVPAGVSLDLLPMGACLIDSELTVREWNRTLVDWTGRARDSMVGTSLLGIAPGLRDDRFRARLSAVFEAGTPAVFSSAIHKRFLPIPSRHGAFRSEPSSSIASFTTSQP